MSNVSGVSGELNVKKCEELFNYLIKKGKNGVNKNIVFKEDYFNNGNRKGKKIDYFQ